MNITKSYLYKFQIKLTGDLFKSYSENFKFKYKSSDIKFTY